MKRLPYITLSLTALALAIHLGGFDQALQWTRQTPDHAVGVLLHWLTIFTSHFTHWHTEHLLWNGLTFLVLGCMVEQRTRIGLVAGVLLSSIAIAALVQTGAPQLTAYRGLSGIDSALFVMAALLMIIRAKKRTPSGLRYEAFIAWAALAAFVSKTIYECVTGKLLFVAPDGFIPCPLAHLAGGAVGLFIVAGWWLKRYCLIEIAQLSKCINDVTTSPTRRAKQSRAAQLRSSHLKRA